MNFLGLRDVTNVTSVTNANQTTSELPKRTPFCGLVSLIHIFVAIVRKFTRMEPWKAEAVIDKIPIYGAVVVAQLVERPLSTPELHCLNPNSDILEHFPTNWT